MLEHAPRHTFSNALFATGFTLAQNSRMAKPANKITAHAASDVLHYEQPLSERMRTFLRLEFLYQQMLYNLEQEADWATRATISTLLDMLAILSRGDVRAEVHKELDQQILTLKRYSAQPGVDSRRLDRLLDNLTDSRDQLAGTGTGYLSPLKQSEFLSAIKHRSAIPGGTCEFDLPEYSHWLRQSFKRRKEDLDQWVGAVRPLCDAVTEVMWLIRESSDPVEKLAITGMYQHGVPRETSCRLIRVSLAEDHGLFPEISGNQHRFTVRFLEWSTVESRAIQTGKDVPFQLSIC